MQIPTRNDVSASSTWDLSPMYASPSAFRKHFVEVEARVPGISQFQGRLGESAQALSAALKEYLETLRQVERLYTYAHLVSDQDTANAANLGSLDQAFTLYTRFSALASYITPELLSVADETIEAYLREPCLAPYQRLIRETLRYRPHTLSKQEEELLAQGAEVFASCDKVFSQLNNADLQFEPLILDGVEQPLSHGNFILYLKNKNREIRREAFQKYYSVFDAHKHTLAATLGGAIRRDLYLARAKKFPSALAKGLFPDNVSEVVYTNLIDSVSDLLAPLHRYYKFRRQALKLDKLELFDVHVPLIPDVETRYPFPAAVDAVIEATRPLGEEYTALLGEGLREGRWVDVYENKGKRSGAYSSGCYDSPAYMLMNYKEDNIGDLFTLAHEAGHSMHTTFSNRTQSYQDHDYTIFVAEVASTLNEQLLLAHLRRVHNGDKKMLAFLINHQLDEIKNTLYRQTMFAEFERDIHALAEQGEPLTLDVFESVYGKLLKKYFGDEVVIHENAWIECFRIPHFYSAFYVYKYATGISAAISLTRQISEDGPKATERYLNFLKSGRSKHPLDLLRDVGVDMTSPAPIRDALGLFDQLLTALERAVT